MRRGSCAYFGGGRSWSATGLALLYIIDIDISINSSSKYGSFGINPGGAGVGVDRDGA